MSVKNKSKKKKKKKKKETIILLGSEKIKILQHAFDIAGTFFYIFFARAFGYCVCVIFFGSFTVNPYRL